ncbi:MAG TPA: DUF523 domain-containing protein [Candidatus Omnitrophica bacterium]|nr:DUF523 domain-containing protein [Candidatus Omnitrophota bacterium]
MAKEKIMLSACLAGINCVYDGTNKLHPFFAEMYAGGEALIFCPEVLGGLKIPHDPSEISGGDGFDCLESKARVVSKKGDDVTRFFLKGAEKVFELAKKNGIKKAVMKSKSPSCGCGYIFNGTFSKKLILGYGVCAALLKKNGIEVISDTDYLKNEE